MPYVNLRVAGKLDKQQKAELAKEITKVITNITGKPESATYLVIDEVARENWAKGGTLLE